MSDDEIRQAIADVIRPLYERFADLEQRLSWLENPQLKRDALARERPAAPDFQRQVGEPKTR